MLGENNMCVDGQDVCLCEARYSKLKTWFSIAVMSIPGLFLTLFSVDLFRHSSNLSAIFFSIVSLLFWFAAIDSILFLKICFYKNRVVKHWYFSKKVTVYYSNLVFTAPPDYLKCWYGFNVIMKTDRFCRTVFPQVPIFYFTFFFASHQMQIINRIVDKLINSNRNYPCHSIKSVLEKE